jgi:hypothetical protein
MMRPYTATLDVRIGLLDADQLRSIGECALASVVPRRAAVADQGSAGPVAGVCTRSPPTTQLRSCFEMPEHSHIRPSPTDPIPLQAVDVTLGARGGEHLMTLPNIWPC